MKRKKENILLTKKIIPKEYYITIHPDLSTFTFIGEEEIILDINETTNKIRIHADELQITKAVFNNIHNGTVTFDKATETATISFSNQLPKGEGRLKLEFLGIINDKMRGLYRSKYHIEGDEHVLAVTQFESTDARRCFPCFDEPSKKAIFHISLIVPKDHTAISNTIDTEIKEHSTGFKIVKFEPTPKMSTYLLAFVVGKFEYIQRKTKEGTLIRVFVTPGKKKQAEFALSVAVKTMSFFSDYFKIPYPLPVIDLIAIPDFAAGAMENWGAVTYRETALLVDEEHSATINKQWVAIVIAHEFAHQWFGNLVTMEWWTHLWLNEGFASYIEYLAVDHIFPEWDIWTQFISMDHTRALELDGLENTHPIEVEVHNPAEISEIFDSVSYSKGSSIIRMLAEYLGENTFRDGLRLYLKMHSYSNASTSDLWRALEKVSEKPVENIMKNWTQKAGYPLITVDAKKNKISLNQERFFSSIHSEIKSKDSTVWKIPISISTNVHAKPEYFLMNSKKIDISLKEKIDWLKVNVGETSLLRVRYADDDLDKLLQSIKHSNISIVDRYGIVRDILVLAEAGKTSTVNALKSYSFFTNEESYIVWVEIVSQLAKIWNVLSEENELPIFEKYALNILRDIGSKVGWDKKSKETHSETLLRSIILSSLGKYNDEETIIIATEKFNQMLNGKAIIESDLRGVVYTIVARYGDNKTYSNLLKLYKNSSLQEEKDRLFKALCMFRQKNLLQQTLDLSFSSEVRTQDSYKAIYFIFANPNGRSLAWDFLKKNWTQIVKQYSGGHLFSRFAEPIEFFTKEKDAKQVEAFFKKNPAPGAARTIKQAVEKIRSTDEWLKRDYNDIKSFLLTTYN